MDVMEDTMTSRIIRKSTTKNIFFPNDIIVLGDAANLGMGAIKWEVDYNWEQGRMMDDQLCLNAALSDALSTGTHLFTLCALLCYYEKPFSKREELFVKRYPIRYFLEKKLGYFGEDHTWNEYFDASVFEDETENYYLRWVQKKVDRICDRTVLILEKLMDESFILITNQDNMPSMNCRNFFLDLLRSSAWIQTKVFSTFMNMNERDMAVLRPYEFMDEPVSSAIAVGREPLLAKLFSKKFD